MSSEGVETVISQADQRLATLFGALGASLAMILNGNTIIMLSIVIHRVHLQNFKKVGQNFFSEF